MRDVSLLSCDLCRAKEGKRILATLDESAYSPDFTGENISIGAGHPIIWKHCVSRCPALHVTPGRALYKECTT